MAAVPAAIGGYLTAAALKKDRKKWALYGAIGAPVALFGSTLIGRMASRK